MVSKDARNHPKLPPKLLRQRISPAWLCFWNLAPITLMGMNIHPPIVLILRDGSIASWLFKVTKNTFYTLN